MMDTVNARGAARRARRLLLIIAACAVITLPACGRDKDRPKDASAANQAAPAKALTITTAEVAGKTIQRTVETTGTLEAWEEVVVSSEISGTVVRINADLGDKVQAGDMLAGLDQREARLVLDDAEAALQTSIKTVEKEKARSIDAETTLRRYDELFKAGMVPASQYDNVSTQRDVLQAAYNEALARRESSEARLSIAKKRLSDTVIKSPISGVVSRKMTSIGETVKEKTGMFVVVTSGNLKFRGTVSEVSVPHVRPGQDIVISVEAFPGRAFNGTLKRVSPAVSIETRSLEVEGVIPNDNGVLRPGFFATGTILTSKEDGVPFAPSAAVYTSAGVTKVFIIKEGAAIERLIKTHACGQKLVICYQ
ncbi:MAG: efflux RND transporter periplasmic adaptor subunit [Deltaproteobacteria bacterium]|nr:efflux RND transporter periplasmic adaptor subunit [Deltaproteobacteria bacterium]